MGDIMVAMSTFIQFMVKTELSKPLFFVSKNKRQRTQNLSSKAAFTQHWHDRKLEVFPRAKFSVTPNKKPETATFVTYL